MMPSVGATPPRARPAEPGTAIRRKSVAPPAPVTVDVSTVVMPASWSACVTRVPEARAESSRSSAWSVEGNVITRGPSAHLLVPAFGPRRALLGDGAPVVDDQLLEIGGAAQNFARDVGGDLHRAVRGASVQLGDEGQLDFGREEHVYVLPRQVFLLRAARDLNRFRQH